MTDWSKPVDVSKIDLVFPADVMGKMMPYYKDLPEEFNGRSQWRKNAWCKQAEIWFFNGVDSKKSTIKFKKHLTDAEQKMAVRQIQACLGSFEPKHEHKMAGVGYLMSLFFEKLKVVGIGK